MTQISVIIPCYNCAPVIGRCLDSIEYIRKRCPEVMPYERLKYMRWVGTPKAAVESQIPYDEYINYLNEFKKLGVYPLDYRWIRAVHWYDTSSWNWLKDAAKTFLTNHPCLGYLFYQKRLKRK